MFLSSLISPSLSVEFFHWPHREEGSKVLRMEESVEERSMERSKEELIWKPIYDANGLSGRIIPWLLRTKNTGYKNDPDDKIEEW